MTFTAPPSLSTYRLQCHADFTLDDARRLLPYFCTLGVTHLYLSPVLRSRRGSTHGYDGIDPRAVDPELGGREALERLATAAHDRGLGLIVDTVPNHLSTSFENPAWRDVLTHGRCSPWARWFDIDWDHPDADLRGRVLCPLLGGPLEEVLENGELSVAWEGDRFVLCYFDHRLPLSAASVPLVAAATGENPPDPQLVEALGSLGRGTCGSGDRVRREDAEELLDRIAAIAASDPDAADWLRRHADDFAAGPRGSARMMELLGRQAYLLTAWQEASSRINYRRFFDINELVCVRQEDPVVFEETHATLLELVAAGHLDGLRIDHVDGLLDPLGYLQSLRQALVEARPDQPMLLFVEKILAEGEELPESWPVDGTTGYEFLNQVEQWLVSPGGFDRIEVFYRELTGGADRFHLLAEQGKRRVLRKELHAPASALARELVDLAGSEGLELGEEDALDAVVEMVTALPVYRTYADGETTRLDEAEEGHVRIALQRARRSGRAADTALEFLGRLLLLRIPDGSTADDWLGFVQRFQQLSGPAAAKGIEDTALYAYAPLASLNEVGGEPVLPDHDSGKALHHANGERAKRFPRGMLAVSTHDTKRSADVRARLDVLSEIPQQWCERVEQWCILNAPHRSEEADGPSPGPFMEFLFYQSLLALWPLRSGVQQEQAPDAEELRGLEERLVAYMEKAAREAKRRTSWADPDPVYEAALTAFVRAVLAPDNEPFLGEVHRFVRAIGRAGWWNALAQSVLQLTSPGTPDIFQGDELWDLSLVDPDNRRPVDYARRTTLLDEVARETQSDPDRLARLCACPEDGRLKLHVIHSLLVGRKRLPDLFASGDYRPVEIRGDQAGHLLAFLRLTEREVLLVVVCRHTLGLPGIPSRPPTGADCWAPETGLALPEEIGVSRWESLLGAAPLTTPAGTGGVVLSAAEALAELPVAAFHGRR